MRELTNYFCVNETGEKCQSSSRWKLLKARLWILLLLIPACLLTLELTGQDCTVLSSEYFNPQLGPRVTNGASAVYPGESSGYCLTGKGQQAAIFEVYGTGVQSRQFIDIVSGEMRLRHGLASEATGSSGYTSLVFGPDPNVDYLNGDADYTLPNSSSEVIYANDLIITEVVYRKYYDDKIAAVEIYNGTTTSVDLNLYKLEIQTYDYWTDSFGLLELDFNPNTILQQDETYVLAVGEGIYANWVQNSPRIDQVYQDPDPTVSRNSTYILREDSSNDIVDIFGNIDCEDGLDEVSYYSSGFYVLRKYFNYCNNDEDEDHCHIINCHTPIFDASYLHEPRATLSNLGYHPEYVTYDSHAETVALKCHSNAEGIAPRGSVEACHLQGLGITPWLSGLIEGDVFVSCNSWGDGVSDGCPTNYGTYSGSKNKLGSYDNHSQAMDEALFDAPEHLLCKSAENVNGCGNVDNHDNLVEGAATAKNPIVVGCINSSKIPTGPSGRGPTDDGRIKPDIVANYSTNNNKGATSFSTPKVTGAAMLLHEQWDNLVNPSNYNINPHNGSSYPLAATMKGILIHGAAPCGGAYTQVPNYACGWGALDVEASADAIAESAANGDQNIQERTFNNEEIILLVQASGLDDLKATLAWTDQAPANLPGNPPLPLGTQTGSNGWATPLLINDLNLKLKHVNTGQTTLPWTLDLNDPLGAPIRAVDNLNNVEKVSLEQSQIAAGDYYELVISAESLPLGGGSQDFSIIVTGGDVVEQSVCYSSEGDLYTSPLNGGFESPIVGSGFLLGASNANWEFNGTSGIAGNGSAYTQNNPDAPEKDQVAFLQKTGSICQTINVVGSNTYYLLFKAAQRKQGNNLNTQKFQLLVDGNAIQSFSPVSMAYDGFASIGFTLDEGCHEICLLGLNPNGGDHTALIDDLRLSICDEGANCLNGQACNSSFESPEQGSGFTYAPENASWTFTGASGIAGNNSGFTNNNPDAPEGDQVAFLQGANSRFCQSINITESGTYQLYFFAAQRMQAALNDQTIRIEINGEDLESINPNSASYNFYLSDLFGLPIGCHEICFSGTTAGANTAFVDMVGVLKGSCDNVLSVEDFQDGWGIWQDGGVDAVRLTTSTFAYSGNTTIRLRDNSWTSNMTTENLDLSGANHVRIDFTYLPRSMDSASEDFWLQVSTNGGSSFTTVEEWNLGDEFENLERYFESVLIDQVFTSDTKFRFRCDANGDWDFVHIDNVVISACGVNSLFEQIAEIETAKSPEIEDPIILEAELEQVESNLVISPNPSSSKIKIEYSLPESGPVQISLFDLSGKLVKHLSGASEQMGQDYELELDLSDLENGAYIVQLETRNSSVQEKVILMK